MLYGLVILHDKKKYEKVIRDISGVAVNVIQIAMAVGKIHMMQVRILS